MSHFSSSVRVLQMALIQLPQLGDLAAGHILEDVLVVLLVLERFVQLADGAIAVPALDPVEEVRGLLIASVPLAVGFFLPMWRRVSGI